ncbi:MAG: TonB-dependent receptor domain-containing protein [Bacteroidota bacterium]
MSTSRSLMIILILFIIPAISIAQQAKITGVVKDKITEETIVGATVVIKGTTKGTTTDIDGNFVLGNLKPGNYNLEVSFISYNKVEIDNISLSAGEEYNIDVEMEEVTFLLDVVTVTAKKEMSGEKILMIEQKNASNITLNIGSQELSRKGASDVSSAVAKASGVSREEGSSKIYVRGLGDRYLSTTMNGLPIPSNNPELKNISLELFTIDIVEFVSIDKVYNNRIFGDFAGGNIDIVTKNRNKDNFFFLELGSNANNHAYAQDEFLLHRGPDYFGFYSIEPPSTLQQYAFQNSLQTSAHNPLGTDMSLSAGKVFHFKKHELNVFSTVKFSNEYQSYEGISLNVNSSGVPSKDLSFLTSSYNTNTTAMFNAGYEINNDSRLNYNFILVNSSNQTNEDYHGTIIDIADYDNGRLIRGTYEKNTLMMNQLLGVHSLSASSDINWGVSYNNVSSDLPDRIQNTFRSEGNTTYFGQNQITDNHRYYHYLDEYEIAGNVDVDYSFNKDSEGKSKGKIIGGGFFRTKNRDFNSTQFNFRIAGEHRDTPVFPENLDLFFNQQNFDNDYFTIETFRGNYQVPGVLDPQEYSGKQNIYGGFLNLEYNLSPKLLGIIGLRTEYIYQQVSWNTQLDPMDREDAFYRLEFLPMLASKYLISDKQNLRFAASKTYTLPQFKERAFFIYEEVTQVKIGNPDLYPSENYNADLKWELFPSNGEIVSVGVFGKYILNPINEVTISSATNDISFLNSGDWGYVAGFELELKKELLDFGNSNVFTGFNFTFLETEQELNSEKVREETRYIVSFTHDSSDFAGAAVYLINADITYKYAWKNDRNRIIATLAYQHTSDKIYAIGTDTRGNIIDKAFGTLDFILKSEFGNRFGIGINIKNLLNPEIQKVQDNENSDITVLSYKRGINAGIKINYKF